MQKIAEITHPATSDHLVLNLWRHSDGSTFVSSVEVIDKKSRLRLSCCERTRPQDVFSKEVFEKLTYVFQQCSDLRGFLSLPDLKLSVGDLVLVGCRIMVSATKSGVEQVLVRFSKCYGKFNTLFRPEFRHRDSFASEGVERAVDALEKIYLPLRNFSKFLEEKMQDPTEQLDKTQENQFLHKVNDQIHELDFYMDMITHYVASQAKLAQEEEEAAEPQVQKHCAPTALPGVYL